MKLYIRKLATSEFKIELLTYYIIFLENKYKNKYQLLNNNMKNFIDLHLIKYNKNNIQNLLKYDTLYKKFQDLTLNYNLLCDEYKKNNLKNLLNFNNLCDEFNKLNIQYKILKDNYNTLLINNKDTKSSDFKISKLNILRFI